MKLSMRFTGPFDVSDFEQVQHVRRQVREWADAEPNVEAVRIMKVYRPDPHLSHTWRVDVHLKLHNTGESAEQMEMAL